MKANKLLLSVVGKPLAIFFIFLLRRLFASTRTRFGGVENIRAAEAQCGGYLLAMWHEHALTGTAGYYGQPVGALVSPSRDGEYLADILTRMGAVPVRGSTNQRGKQARDEIKRFVQDGVPIAITIDGPRGPHRECKPGIVALARATGLPILPGVAVNGNPWVLGTWDKMQIPKPFSKQLMYHGEIFTIPEDLGDKSFDEWREYVADRVAETHQEAVKAFENWDDIPKGSPRETVGPAWVRAMVAKHSAPLSEGLEKRAQRVDTLRDNEG